MNCPYCTKPLEGFSGDKWPKCERHGRVVVYCHKLSNEMQWWISSPKQHVWFCWDEDRFRIRITTIGSKSNDWSLKLNYHPQIRPEEAQDFLDRIMKMKAFT